MINDKGGVDGVSKSDIEHQADVGHVRAGQVLEDGDEIEQLVVVGIREPTADGDGMLRVEDVRCGRVVDDDGVFEVPPDLRKILDVVPLMVVAALAEKPMMDDVVDIQLIQQGVTVLNLGSALGSDPSRAGRNRLASPWRQKP